MSSEVTGSRLCVQMAENVLTVAYDSGVNLFDTAEVYASGRYRRNCLSVYRSYLSA